MNPRALATAAAGRQRKARNLPSTRQWGVARLGSTRSLKGGYGLGFQGAQEDIKETGKGTSQNTSVAPEHSKPNAETVACTPIPEIVAKESRLSPSKPQKKMRGKRSAKLPSRGSGSAKNPKMPVEVPGILQLPSWLRALSLPRAAQKAGGEPRKRAEQRAGRLGPPPDLSALRQAASPGQKPTAHLASNSIKWVWLKIQDLGLRRCSSTFPFTRVPFWAPIFEPQPNDLSPPKAENVLAECTAQLPTLSFA